MNDTDTLASLIEEHTRLFTADYDSRDDEAVAFERIDAILPELRSRCGRIEPAPDDDALFAVLVGALESEDAEVHEAAYVGLGRLRHPQVVPLFLQRINHDKSRFGFLINRAEEADAEMAVTLRQCLDRMPGAFDDRCFAEVAVHLAETRNGTPRNPALLERALSTAPKPFQRWLKKMAETIRGLDVEEVEDVETDSVEDDIEPLARVTSGFSGDGRVRGLAWSPDGARAYVGLDAGETTNGLRTFDPEGSELESPKLINREVTDLALSRDGRWLAVAAREGRSAIVDTASGEVVREVDENLAATSLCVAFSPDDGHVAFSGNRVVVLSVDDWALVDTFTLPVAPDVQAAHDWLTQTSTSRKGALKALALLEVTPNWRRFAEKFARGSHRWKLLHDALPDSRPNALAWLDPNRLLVGGQAVFEKRLGEDLRLVNTPPTSRQGIWPDSRVVGLASDEQHIYVATRDGLVRYDHQLEGETSFEQIEFASVIVPDGKRAFVGCYGRGGLWCIDGDEATRLEGPVNVGSVATRHDGSVWCGEHVVSGWDPDLTPLDGPQHNSTIVGIFEDADGHAVTCDDGGNIVRHASGEITNVPDSGRCVCAGASAGAEWIALGFEGRRAGELVCLRGDEVIWRKTQRKGKPWCPMFRDEHVFFVADSKLKRCTLDGKDVRTPKLAKLQMRATALGPELVAYGHGKHLVIVNLANQKVVEQRQYEEDLRGLAGTPDGRRLCLAFGHGTIDVIDVATMELRAVVHADAPGVVTCTNDALYVTCRAGLLKHVFGTSAVEILGTLPLERPWPSTMAVVGEEVWVGDHSGLLARAPL